ncbi:hypothetical protein FCH28_11565 [Streptomyces piniterrae]|uniref:Uncharacterized protein n=2 Tax=Streptomyces piniterrae TaxID=2571125 RepID=A0A4U0NP61_9ACTN|nr:hypothetical protein FCH28_11565 [Streptomyces piniterrae]
MPSTARTTAGCGADPALFDFRDCPALPAGADPAKWRCEVFVMHSSIKLGALDIRTLAPMAATNAEGPLPDGGKGQVFGGLRAGPTRVDNAPAPFGGALRLLPQYAGFSDFYSDGVHRGALDMKFRLQHPMLDEHCTIGADADPVKLRFLQDGTTEWVSKEPPILRFAVHDTAFAAPRSYGCGPLGKLVDRRLGLPAPSGQSKISATAFYTFRSYDRLPTGS